MHTYCIDINYKRMRVTIGPYQDLTKVDATPRRVEHIAQPGMEVSRENPSS